MQTNLLELLCKKNSISYIIFDQNFHVRDANGLTLQKGSDIREYLWELTGMEEAIYSLLKNNDSLEIPMLLRNDLYYDLDINTFISENEEELFIAYMQQKSKQTYEYANALKEMNKKTLIYEISDEKKQNDYYKEINKHLMTFHVNLEGMITMVNDACIYFFDLQKEKMLGKHFSNFFQPQKSQLDQNTTILIAKNATQEDIYFHADIIPIKDTHAKIVENIIIAQDITHLKKIKRELEYAQEHDALTGLANRHSFLKKIDAMIKENNSFTLCFIDIDDFHLINEDYGAHGGDMLLKHFTSLLHDFLDPQDTLVRIGGDTFAVIFEADKEETYIKMLLQDLHILTANNPLYYNQEDIIKCSYTTLLMHYPDDYNNSKDLLINATKSLKRKKIDTKALKS